MSLTANNVTTIANRQPYQGFEASQFDGYLEVWKWLPGANTLSSKLFDAPAPSFLIAPSKPMTNCR
jgi:hypothetical protein